MFDKVSRLAQRLSAYPPWQVLLEIGIIWLVVYVIIRFVQGTRAAGALKGTVLLFLLATLVVRILGEPEAFQRLKFLYDNFLTLLAVALIVVFQPELRRGLIRLGETPLLRRASAADRSVVDAVADASAYLSRARFGGLIVIERQTPLKGLVEGGTHLGAKVSARLLQTIFFPGSALHDLAVVIHNDEIRAAGVQLPLAEPEEMPDPTLGSRHRAAVGLSKECDALVVVVSEETGAISLAERGRLDQGLGAERLKSELNARLARPGVLSLNAPSRDSAAHRDHDAVHADLTDPRD
jgi:diadenylate cyclase